MSNREKFPCLRFLLEIQGLIVGGFSEVSGLSAETEVEIIEEGGVNDYVHRLPKKTKYPNLVLKRGITDSNALWKWHKDVANAKISRKSGYIILVDSEGNEKWRWSFVEAYPVKWSGPELKADSNTITVESLELVHNGIMKAPQMKNVKHKIRVASEKLAKRTSNKYTLFSITSNVRGRIS